MSMRTGGGRGGGRKTAAAPRTFQLPEAADGWATINVHSQPCPQTSAFDHAPAPTGLTRCSLLGINRFTYCGPELMCNSFKYVSNTLMYRTPQNSNRLHASPRWCDSHPWKNGAPLLGPQYLNLIFCGCRTHRAVQRRRRCASCWMPSRAPGCVVGCRPASSGSGPSWRLQACLIMFLELKLGS